ncbi:MAG: TIR domain-containing protein [Betaproteobacteria bacterium]|nr:TIR domain-containing protein [Betaproteobacteria bacterium]
MRAQGELGDNRHRPRSEARQPWPPRGRKLRFQFDPCVSTLAKAVFLSYASQDAEVARRLCDALRALRVEVWFDQSALRGGDAWDASIRRQIKECALFVPVISANTQARVEGYFRREWNLAVNRTLDIADDQAFLLPVVIDATIDVNARVPEKFREVQWTHLPGGEAAAGFAERVQRLLAGGAGSVPAVHAVSAAARGDAAMADTHAAVPTHDVSSIAVLPFVNRSHDEEDEYFSDGLADELLNVMTKIRGLRVAARSSAFTFKGKGATVAEVGRALNVATVLEGSVRKSGNRMRISVQLVKVADGYHLWSQSYDRTLEDIFAVQDDIAQAVVTELRTTLLGEAADAKIDRQVTVQVAAAMKGRATDPEAHRLYLQARHLVDRHTREDTAKAIGYLKQALALDPDFALAWAELGRAYGNEAGSGWAPVAEGHARARKTVARALALEPDLAEAHAQMGFIQMQQDWDWRGAEVSMHRALELAPGDAVMLRGAGMLAMNLGRLDEAIALYHQALAQDPLSAAAYHNLGLALYAADRLAEAEAALGQVLELAPQQPIARALLSLVLLAQGRGEEALAEVLREPEELARLWASAVIHHTAGRREESEAALEALIAKYQVEAACQVAEVYAMRGQADRAVDWLERAYVQRDAGLAEMKPDPLFRSLHTDPRWGTFLRKMGLAD